MSEIKLFNVRGKAKELQASNVKLEREIQTIVENNMLDFFGVRFLQSEYVIKEGRMDSIGIDEDYSPVIFEYKRSTNENVINQGLFYLDWLLEHKADYKLLVLEKLGKEYAEKIDWTMPRVVCVAPNFTKFDLHAIKQINRKISLIKYKRYENDLLLFELLDTNQVDPIINEDEDKKQNGNKIIYKTFSEIFEGAQKNVKEMYSELKDYILSLGEDVSMNTLKYYVSFKKIKNFCAVEVFQKKILVHLSLNPDDYELDEKLKDMRNIGHLGTGDLQFALSSFDDIEKAEKLILDAYHKN